MTDKLLELTNEVITHSKKSMDMLDERDKRIAELERQRDDLQKHNTDLVMERRRLKAAINKMAFIEKG